MVTKILWKQLNIKKTYKKHFIATRSYAINYYQTLEVPWSLRLEDNKKEKKIQKAIIYDKKMLKTIPRKTKTSQ